MNDRSDVDAVQVRIGWDDVMIERVPNPGYKIERDHGAIYILIGTAVLALLSWLGASEGLLLLQAFIVLAIEMCRWTPFFARARNRRLVTFCVVDRNTRTIELRFVREDKHRSPMTLRLDGLSFMAFRGLSKYERDGAGIDLYVGETYTATVGKFMWPAEDLHTLERHLRALGVPSRTDGMVLEATAWKERFLSKYPEFRRKG